MKKVFCLLLCWVMTVSVFTSCKKDGGKTVDGNSPSASTDTPAPEEVIIPDDEVIAEMGLENVGREVTGTAIDLMEKADDAVTIKIEDYGAVGDGKTSDAAAVKKAITDLKKLPAGSTLEFKADTTYYLQSRGAAFSLSGMENYIIKGNNTTILIDAPMYYLAMNNCKNIAIQGLNFNYNTKPYAYSTEIGETTKTRGSATAVVTLDRSLNIEGTYTAPSAEFFALVAREDGRYHMSISSIEVIDADAYKYKITFNNTFGNITDRVDMLSQYGIIVPMPDVGHTVAHGFEILNNTDVLFENCNVWSTCKFSFLIKQNEGKVIFNNLNLTPDPNETQGNTGIVGWRDGFHCKENRAQLIWKDCTLEDVYDDMFNISCSMLTVKSVKSGKINLSWPETNGAYNMIKEGDTVSFYDTETGINIGTTTVKTVSGDTITLEEDLEGIDKGVYVAVNSLAAPNSQIINCKIKGTLRFRTPMYIVDSDIHCTRMWLAFESTGAGFLEGPIAENILFSNCNFTFDNDEEQFIEIFSSGGTAIAKSVEDGTLSQDDIYHINNIVFRNCEIDTDRILYDDVEAYCDDVVIIDNTEA